MKTFFLNLILAFIGHTTTSWRVHRGAKLLDRTLGKGWASNIDIYDLDMSDMDNCVLGQLFGEYLEGLDTLGFERLPDTDKIASYGLDTSLEQTEEPSTYQLLDVYWICEIKRRLQ